jgi:phosphate transport system permease protein
LDQVKEQKQPASGFKSEAGSFFGPGFGDRLFNGVTFFFALCIVVLALGMAWQMWMASRESIHASGWHFLASQDWDPVKESFGSLAFVFGTLVSAAIAFAVAVPLALAIAIYLAELAPSSIAGPLSFLVEILAAIPSVVYGLWGMFVLAPFLRIWVFPVLMKAIGKPFFVGPSIGLSLFTSGILLAIMILPTIMSISREVFRTVPNSLRESALALGATRWEMIVLAVLKPSRTGLMGAAILGLGRALGETMAVTMVIGNRAEITANLLAPSDSMASVIANQFSEATSSVHLAALAELGLLLMGVTILLNILARVLLWATTSKYKA